MTYPFLSKTRYHQARKSVWVAFEDKFRQNEIILDDRCEQGQNEDCWHLDGSDTDAIVSIPSGPSGSIYRFTKGTNLVLSTLDVVDIKMNVDRAESEFFGLHWVYLCLATNAVEPEYPKPEPEPPIKPPSGQWNKCEEIPICTSPFQPAGWTYQGYYQRVACYEQGALITGDGDIRIRQSEFEKTNRFNTNSALWIVGTENFKSDTIANQCERNQENGCWRAIGKGERLFKIMRGWNDGATNLDTTVINVDGFAERMIICDADQHSFDVDEPNLEAELGHPYMENKYCVSEIMWHNSEGEAAQRWTLSEEEFPALSPTIDAEKIYTDGNGRYMYWEWIAFQGRWYITT